MHTARKFASPITKHRPGTNIHGQQVQHNFNDLNSQRCEKVSAEGTCQDPRVNKAVVFTPNAKYGANEMGGISHSRKPMGNFPH